MGFSYVNDETPRMCFNGPKSWQLGWYDDRHIDISSGSLWSGKVYGISDYTASSEEDAVIIRISSSSADEIYISYNRAFGINEGTFEGKNQVLVHTKSNNFGTSRLVAKLSSGDTYTIGGNEITCHSAGNDHAVVQIGDTWLTPTPSSSPSSTIPTLSTVPSKAPSSFCSESEMLVKVRIETDFCCSEDVSWEIVDVNGDVIEEQPRGSYALPYNTYEEFYCLPQTESCGASDYIFSVSAYYEDAFGIYKVYVSGELVGQGTGSFYYEDVQIPGCIFSNSNQPTTHPSSSPSRYPSNVPSRKPSSKPSVIPSGMPSTMPTANPTVLPSVTPSTYPSMMPSRKPTDEPTDRPSATPSSAPSVAPSDYPSRKPSRAPSNVPSSSVRPSLFPSHKPSTSSPTKSSSPSIFDVSPFSPREVVFLRINGSSSNQPSKEQLSQSLFGLSNSLKSQIEECSGEKLSIQPAGNTSPEGVVDINLSQSIVDDGEASIIETSRDLYYTSPHQSDSFDHLFFCLPSGTMSSSYSGADNDRGKEIYLNHDDCLDTAMQMKMMGFSFGLGKSEQDRSGVVSEQYFAFKENIYLYN